MLIFFWVVLGAYLRFDRHLLVSFDVDIRLYLAYLSLLSHFHVNALTQWTFKTVKWVE
jgi:hypothetical protein